MNNVVINLERFKYTKKHSHSSSFNIRRFKQNKVSTPSKYKYNYIIWGVVKFQKKSENLLYVITTLIKKSAS